MIENTKKKKLTTPMVLKRDKLLFNTIEIIIFDPIKDIVH